MLLAKKMQAATCRVIVVPENWSGPKKIPLTLKSLGDTNETLSDMQLIKTDRQNGSQEANVFPLGLINQQVFNSGSMYDPRVIDITLQTVFLLLWEGICVTVPLRLCNEYKQVLALSGETEYTFPLPEKVNS